MANSAHLPPGMRDPMRRRIFNPLQKDVVYWEKYAAETDRAYSQFHGVLGPGGGNPLHYHRTFVETFTALSGRLGLTLGKRETILNPGENASVPIGVNHRFYNPSDTDDIEFRIRTDPGVEDFEKGIHVAYGLAAEGLTDKQGAPSSLVHLAIFMRTADIHPSGLLWKLMTPIFAAVYWYGRWSGEEERLLQRYWY